MITNLLKIIICIILFLAFGSCKSNGQYASVKEWVQRGCCETVGTIEIEKLEISSNVIEFQFNNTPADSVSINLVSIGNDSDLIKINFKYLNSEIALKPNSPPPNYNGRFAFNKELKDGNYSLYLTNEGCGIMYFTLRNGKLKENSFTCINVE